MSILIILASSKSTRSVVSMTPPSQLDTLNPDIAIYYNKCSKSVDGLQTFPAPTIIRETCSDYMTLSWRAVKTALRYTASCTGTGAPTLTTTVNAPALQAVLGPLISGTTYTCTITAALSPSGTSFSSPSTIFVDIPASCSGVVIDPPTLARSDACSYYFTASWKAVKDASRYVVNCQDRTDTTKSLTAEVDAPLLTATLGPVISGHTYRCTLSSGALTSLYSADLTTTIPDTCTPIIPPASNIPAPTVVKIQSCDYSLHVRWTAQNKAASYIATCDSSNGGVSSFTQVSSQLLEATVGPLTKGKTYTCLFQVTRTDGTTQRSQPSPDTTMTIVPTCTPTVTKQTCSQYVDVSWSGLVYTNVDSYITTCTPTTGPSVLKEVTTTTSSIGPLSTNLDYTCTVTVLRTDGKVVESEPSSPATLITDADACSPVPVTVAFNPPTFTASTCYKKAPTVSLEWSAVSNDVTGLIVYCYTQGAQWSQRLSPSATQVSIPLASTYSNKILQCSLVTITVAADGSQVYSDPSAPASMDLTGVKIPNFVITSIPHKVLTASYTDVVDYEVDTVYWSNNGRADSVAVVEPNAPGGEPALKLQTTTILSSKPSIFLAFQAGSGCNSQCGTDAFKTGCDIATYKLGQIKNLEYFQFSFMRGGPNLQYTAAFSPTVRIKVTNSNTPGASYEWAELTWENDYSSAIHGGRATEGIWYHVWISTTDILEKLGQYRYGGAGSIDCTSSFFFQDAVYQFPLKDWINKTPVGTTCKSLPITGETYIAGIEMSLGSATNLLGPHYVKDISIKFKTEDPKKIILAAPTTAS